MWRCRSKKYRTLKSRCPRSIGKREIVERFKSIVVEEDELKANSSTNKTCCETTAPADFAGSHRRQAHHRLARAKPRCGTGPANCSNALSPPKKRNWLKTKKSKRKSHCRRSWTKKSPFEIPQGWIVCYPLKVALSTRTNTGFLLQKQIEILEKKIYDYITAHRVLLTRLMALTHEGRHLLVGEDGANLVARSTRMHS